MIRQPLCRFEEPALAYGLHQSDDIAAVTGCEVMPQPAIGIERYAVTIAAAPPGLSTQAPQFPAAQGCPDLSDIGTLLDLENIDRTFAGTCCNKHGCLSRFFAKSPQGARVTDTCMRRTPPLTFFQAS